MSETSGGTKTNKRSTSKEGASRRSKRTSTVQDAINLGFVQQLRVFRFDRFEFDGHLFTRRHVGTKVNVPKRTTADFTAQPILFPHTQLHRGFLFQWCRQHEL